MAAKPETTYTALIHRQFARLGAVPYFEKTNNPFRSGTPDVYYSGEIGYLWVEYKFIPRIPKNAEILPELSPRQRRWLDDRHDEGRNVMVVLGTPEGGVIYRGKEWNQPLSPTALRERLLTPAEVARKILTEVGASACRSPSLPSP